MFPTHRQKLTADHLFPTLEHKPQEGTGLLQTADQRDVAMLVSTDKEGAYFFYTDSFAWARQSSCVSTNPETPEPSE